VSEHARRTDPDTSHRSALQTEVEEGRIATFRPRTQKHLALMTLAPRPLTAREVGRESRRPEIWKRVSDLKNANLLRDTGLRRRDPETEREGIVWELNDLGQKVLRLLNLGETVKLAP